jgi:hypothetical protein
VKPGWYTGGLGGVGRDDYVGSLRGLQVGDEGDENEDWGVCCECGGHVAVRTQEWNCNTLAMCMEVSMKGDPGADGARRRLVPSIVMASGVVDFEFGLGFSCRWQPGPVPCTRRAMHGRHRKTFSPPGPSMNSKRKIKFFWPQLHCKIQRKRKKE